MTTHEKWQPRKFVIMVFPDDAMTIHKMGGTLPNGPDIKLLFSKVVGQVDLIICAMITGDCH